MGNCLSCGKDGHKVKYCPMIKARGNKGNQDQASGHSLDALKRNHFFALRSKGLTLEDDDVCKSLFSLFNLVSSL